MEYGFDHQEHLSSPPPWVTELINEAMKEEEEEEEEEEEVGFKKPHRALATISRAPRNMRLKAVQQKDGQVISYVPNTYEPELVSIGPFHRNKPSVQAMEDHKRRFLIGMVNQRRSPRSSSSLLVSLAEAMKALEARTRECYSEAFDEDVICSDEFVRMMVLDGCFILQLFRISLRLETFTDVEPSIFSTRWMRSALAFDLLKLENQLPYFVLEQLHFLTKPPENEPPLTYLAQKFLGRFCRSKMHDKKGIPPFFRDLNEHKPDHLLSLFYLMFMPQNHHPPKHLNDTQQIRCSLPCVNDLLLSGIKILKADENINPLDIKFYKNKLTIPHFVVSNNTKVLLGNLIAYEQCNPSVQPYFTSYVMFLDGIVNSDMDIEALRVAGVVDHFLSTNGDVVKLLNNLVSGIDYFDTRSCYLSQEIWEIYRHYHRPRTQFKVRMRRLVASHEGMTYVITIFALYLALLQTVFTVLSYAKHRS